MDSSKVVLIRYIYYQVCGEWLKKLFEKAEIDYLKDFVSKYPFLPDEGQLSNNVRVLGEAIYAGFGKIGEIF